MNTGDKPNFPFLKYFVRFKQHVDLNIVSGFNTIFRHSPSLSSILEMDSPSPSPSSNTSSEANGLASLLFSSYSPANLRRLPQPVPNDLPSHLDSSIFTFEDAFEDLLIVSQGDPLPDIKHKYCNRMLTRRIFPQGEPMWSWLRRLEISGHLSTDPSECQQDRSDWGDFRRELDKNAQAWKCEKPSPEGLSIGEAVHHFRGLFGELERISGNIEKLFNEGNVEKVLIEAERRLDQHHSEPAKQTEQGRDRSSEPDTFEEFFANVHSTHESGQRSWDSFMKAISDSYNTSGNSQKPVSKLETQVVESREEHIDKYGYVHRKVTRRQVDNEGNEVSRSTTYQMRPKLADERCGDQNWEREHVNVGEDVSDGEKTRKHGWFWTKD